jgi:hypothetical protein
MHSLQEAVGRAANPDAPSPKMPAEIRKIISHKNGERAGGDAGSVPGST